MPIRMVGNRTTDFDKADTILANILKGNPALQKKLNVPDGFLNPDRTVNLAVMKKWRSESKKTWHHHQNMQTMQLVDAPVHGGMVSPHTGGRSYADSVLRELKKRNIIMDVNEGLSPELIQRAKELGIIPQGFSA